MSDERRPTEWLSDDASDSGPHADLRGRSVRSGAVQLAAQAAKLVLLMASGMILARLLAPRDFGLLAMVTAVTGLADHIRHFGLPQAVVQGERLSRDQAHALFWHGLRLTGGVAAAMVVAAPIMAFVYGEPRVVAIMCVFAGLFAIQGLTIVHEGVLMRRLAFGTLAFADLTAMTASVVAGVAMALGGWGYWALVMQTVVYAGLRTALVAWRGHWASGPRTGQDSSADLQSFRGYGSNLTRYKVLEYAARNVDRVLVGAVHGSRPLGFYDAAYRWSLYPLNQVAGPLSGVALASLSRVRHEADGYRRAFRAGLLPFFSVVIPALVFFGVEGERVILLLLGDQWGAAVPLFRVLCLSGVAASLIRVSRWLFLVHGTTARQVRWGLAYLPVMAASAAAGLPWGPLGVACGFTVGNWLMVPSAVTSSLRDSHLTIGDVVAVTTRPAAAAAVAALVTAATGLIWPSATLGPTGALALARQGVIFSATLLAMWIAIPGGRQRLREAVELLSESLLRRRHQAPQGPVGSCPSDDPPAPPPA